jgi:hypothetical protein
MTTNLNQQEILWRQKSRVQWLKEGEKEHQVLPQIHGAQAIHKLNHSTRRRSGKPHLGPCKHSRGIDQLLQISPNITHQRQNARYSQDH